jgi:hypothetical protein
LIQIREGFVPKVRPKATAPERNSPLAYIATMRVEAATRRREADEATSDDDRQWYLERAAFFDACADEVQAKLDAGQELPAR